MDTNMSNGSVGIQIGATKEAIEAARDGIIGILTAGHSGKTMRAALKTFSDIASVHDVSIEGSTISVGQPTPKPDASS